MPVPFPDEFIPYHTARKRSTLHVNKVPFGDGYTQRSPASINPIEEVWELEFRGLSQRQGNELETFLTTWKGVDTILWRAPDRNGDFTWQIEAIERSYGRGMHSTLNVTLNRFSDPYRGGFLECHPLHAWIDFSQVQGWDGMIVRPQQVIDRAHPQRRFYPDPRTEWDDRGALQDQHFPVLRTNVRNGRNLIECFSAVTVGWNLDSAPRIEANEDFVVWLAGQSLFPNAHDALLWAGNVGNDATLLYHSRFIGYIEVSWYYQAPDVRAVVAVDDNRAFAQTGGAPFASLPGGSPPRFVATSRPMAEDVINWGRSLPNTHLGRITERVIAFADGFAVWTIRRSGGVVRWYRNGEEYGAAIYTGALGLDTILAYTNTRSYFYGQIGELGAAQGMTLEQHNELITNLGKKWGIPTVDAHE